jgi:hypothetical protein
LRKVLHSTCIELVSVTYKKGQITAKKLPFLMTYIDKNIRKCQTFTKNYKKEF